MSASLLAAGLVILAYPELTVSTSASLANKVFRKAGSTFAASAAFPGARWETATPSEVGMDPAKFDSALATLPSPAVVIRQGKIVGSKGDITRSGYVWSASKSLTALIAATCWARA